MIDQLKLRPKVRRTSLLTGVIFIIQRQRVLRSMLSVVVEVYHATEMAETMQVVPSAGNAHVISVRELHAVCGVFSQGMDFCTRDVGVLRWDHQKCGVYEGLATVVSVSISSNI